MSERNYKITPSGEWFKVDVYDEYNNHTVVYKKNVIQASIFINKWWPNHGYVTIMREGPNGFSEFSTHQEDPLQYAKNIIKENDHPYEDYSKYKLIIKK